MQYQKTFFTCYLFGSLLLSAEEKGLSDTLQHFGVQKKVSSKTQTAHKNTAKQSRFVFKDEYDANGLGAKDKTLHEEKSKQYEYENKSRFKFQFNDGAGNNNFVAGQRNPNTGSPAGGAFMGGGQGEGGGGAAGRGHHGGNGGGRR